MMFKNVICFLICIIVSSFSLEHGKFDVTVMGHEVCKGPKSNYCTKCAVTLENKAVLKFDLHILQDLSVIKGKIIGYLDKQPLVRIYMKDLCKHIFFKPMIEIFFNQTDCHFVQGHYLFNIDIPAITHKYYPDNFIYGNWTFKSSLWSDSCNVHCEQVDINIHGVN